MPRPHLRAEGRGSAPASTVWITAITFGPTRTVPMAVDATPVFWNRILEEVRLRLATQQAYDTWFRPLRARRTTDAFLELEVPNLFFVEWIQEHYLDVLGESARQVLGTTPQVRFVVCPDLEVVVPEDDSVAARAYPSRGEDTSAAGHGPPATPPHPNGGRWARRVEDDPRALPAFRESELNPRYTFETFVVGSSNDLTHAACLAVAARPGLEYNPLFVYGGVGLGKTHLMHAIGHAVRAGRPTSRICYVSAEKFMNEMIASIQNNNSLAFRNKYRKADLLLIDDVQFLAGKDGTQEEFFYTYNTLYDAQNQIVLTSDKPPKDIEDLEERLTSRFNQGLVADIKPPDLETRVAILHKRAEADRFPLTGAIALLIASHVKGNVRELEGCLLRLMALSSLSRCPASMEMAEEVLREWVRPDLAAIDPERIIGEVAGFYGITVEQLKGKRRTNSVALPRQMAMYLMRRTTTLSLTEIGRIFHRDHTTVIHACDKIERLSTSDRSVRGGLESLTEALEGKN
jgi:chromosomal replication initiator protein